MSQAYLIDGQALGPSYFGFTDPLTNTWRPKKYTGNFNVYPDIDLSSTGSGEAIEVDNQATNRFKLFLEYNRILTSLKKI